MFKRGDPSTIFLLLAVGLLLLGGVYLSFLSSDSGNAITGAAGQTTDSCSTCLVCSAQPGICAGIVILMTCVAGIIVLEYTRP